MIKTISFTAVFLCIVMSLPAMDIPDFPAWGADAVPDLYVPHLAGAGAFSTSTGGAPVSAVNPAQGGEAKHIIADIGYLGLVGTGTEIKYGNVVEAGALFPTHFVVLGVTARLIQSPFDTSFPVKTFFSWNLSAAKEIFPRVSLGAGFNYGVGPEQMWFLSGDLGFFYRYGTLGPLENFTWAVVLRSMGKSWTPTWFTPLGGVSFDVLRIHNKEGKRDPFALNTRADIGIPSLVYLPQTSLILKLGLQVEIAETVYLSLSWPGGSGVNTRELAWGGRELFTALPSVGLCVKIPLPSDGGVALDLAYKPLYRKVTAAGVGATWTVGAATDSATTP